MAQQHRFNLRNRPENKHKQTLYKITLFFTCEASLLNIGVDVMQNVRVLR